MILRRVIAHFRKQEWTAIFLDFVIVVAGILIAFQITEWNGARRDRALEREYIERLYADTMSSMETQKTLAEWDDVRMESQSFVLNALRTGGLAEQDISKFNDGLLYFGYLQPIDFRWAAIEELKSTGRIGLIRDQRLRELLVKTEAQYQHRMDMRSFIGDRISAYRKDVDRRFEVVRAANDDLPVELVFDFDALAADTEFINRVSHIAHNANVLKTMAEGHHADTVALKAALEEIRGIASREPRP